MFILTCFRYPTFRYFNYGKKDFKYTGGRVAKDFIKFMEDPREGPPPPPPEPEWKDIPSYVTHLTDDTFEDFMKTHDSVLLMFYAPCKLCYESQNVGNFTLSNFIILKYGGSQFLNP